jgi:hypothetical protein
MKKVLILPWLLLLACGRSDHSVFFVEKEQQIDVMMGHHYFTSYRMDPDYTKPILFPLFSPSGYRVTRGYPLEEIEGESTDHPHHAGLFFTYDRVNGEGFWNNTTIPPQVKHESIIELKNGKKGRLAVRSFWLGKEGHPLLEENRTMVFSAEKQAYTIDFRIVLTAQDTAVTFEDTKEGMFAIRVASWLQEENGTGEYLSSEGEKGSSLVWGKRARWMRLEGQYGGATAGIVILNHPESVNYPTFWHARGYGLFSANPLGQSVFESQRGLAAPQPFSLHLAPKESAVFRFRVIIYEESMPGDRIESYFRDYQSTG